MADILLHKSYEQRKPEASTMHNVIREQLNTFMEELELENRFVPAYILKSFERYLECGIPSYGVVKIQCEDCGKSFALPFSCKCRGICPSCHARRAAEVAVHMVENVFPRVPVRQYVVNFPFPLRLWVASSKHILSEVCAIVCTLVKNFILKRATHEANAEKDPNIRTGLVCFVQRFGSSLNLNPHFHIIAVDGAYFCDEGYRPIFVAMSKPSDEEIAILTRSISESVNSYLIDKGFLVEDGDLLLAANTEGLFEADVDADVHAPAMASSISQTIAFGPRRGMPVQRLRTLNPGCGTWPNQPKSQIKSPLCASYDGYSVHAYRYIPAHDKESLEKLVSYAARGPLSDDRLKVLEGGNVQVKLKTFWSDGTTHLVFTPSEFIEKLIALIPPPWFHMLRYFGVFVSNSKYREEVVPSSSESKLPKQKKPRYIKWADLLKRVFDVDVSKCSECGGAMRILGPIMPGQQLKELLESLKLAKDPPLRSPSKASHLFSYGELPEAFCE